jgi:hypothetical protein
MLHSSAENGKIRRKNAIEQEIINIFEVSYEREKNNSHD